MPFYQLGNKGELDGMVSKSSHSRILYFLFQESLVLCANKDETYCKVYGEIHYCLLVPAVGSGITSLGNSKIIVVMHRLKE